MGYDPAKDPRNGPRYKKFREASQAASKAAGRPALRDDADWQELKAEAEKANAITEAAKRVMERSRGGDFDPNSREGKALIKAAGGKRQAAKAIENCKVNGGAKPGILRRLLG